MDNIKNMAKFKKEQNKQDKSTTENEENVSVIEERVEETDKVQKELESIKGMLARALADYDNLKRRSEEERMSWVKFSSLSIVSKLLPIMDILEKAQEHLKDAGLAIAILEFKKVFIEEGLEEIDPKVGSQFDEDSQEVIEVIDGKEDNMISEVVVKGWKLKDQTAGETNGKIVRHAKVKVSKNTK